MTDKKDCKEGYDGMCCCNCQHQVKLFCHPSNGKQLAYGFLEDKRQIGVGAINQQMGWICEGLRYDNNHVMFFDFEHGMCEEWMPRKPEKLTTPTV